eukprot:TRINITY_DN13469_c0_g1_i1.p1 TRINITY_DN13469_c0_g1~~TRINITY_DN13469_c0_g1_i1.p1  ORF type:complete len:1307 (+),score=384.17 TRINITY_DN13469_c0_g1_i1:102-4022(+)
MTSIDKLLIQGIRSFSPDEPSMITFEKPLTVICGHNGAGKTTIIECLKHSCTGEMPPNSARGHTFVHDPKVTGRTEVKARTKLAFHTAGGKAMICSRSFQLTQKQSKHEFKVLDSSLVTYDSEHKKVSQSMKCADLDREIPELMGAGKAILEFVVFCHQEDSNWPLSDGATLKKKFDDIFAATRYTKALEVLKKNRQEQAAKSKEFKGDMAILETYKKQAESMRRDVEIHREKINDFDKDTSALAHKIAAAEAELAQLQGMLKKIEGVQAEMNSLEAKKAEQLRNREKLYDMMAVEYDDTDEELLLAEQKIQRDVGAAGENVAACESSLADARNSASGAQRSLQEQERNFGKLQGEAVSCERNEKERKELCQKLSKTYDVPFEGSKLTPEVVGAFVSSMNRKLSSSNDALMDLKLSLRKREEEVQTKLMALRTEETEKKEQQRQKTRQLDALATTRLQVTNEAEGIKASQQDLDKCVMEEGRLNAELQALRSSGDHQGVVQQIARLDQQRSDLSYKIGAVSDEIKSLSARLEEQTALQLRREELQKTDSEMRQLIESRKQSFMAALDRIPTPARMDEEMAKAIRQKKEAVNSVAEQLQERKNKLSSVQGRLKAAEESRAQLLQRKKDAEQKLADGGLAGKTLPEAIAEAEKKAERAKHDNSMVSSLHATYTRFLEQANQDQCCPLCHRGYDQARAFNELLDLINEKIAKVPELQVMRKQQVAQADAHVKKLNELMPQWTLLQRIQEQELPDIKKKMEQYQQEENTLAASAKEMADQSEKQNAELTSMQALRQDAVNIQRMHSNMEKIKQKVEELEQSLSVRSGQRTLQDANTERDALEKSRNEVDAQLKDLNRIREDRERQLSDIEKKISAAKIRHQSIGDLLANKRRLEAQIQRDAEQCRGLEHDIQALKLETQRLAQEMQRASQQKTEVVTQAQQQEQQMHDKVSGLQRDVDLLMNLTKAIDQFRDSEKPVQLGSAQRVLDDLRAQAAAHDKRASEIMAELEGWKKKQQEAASNERKLRDNIEYRAECKRIEDTERMIKAKQAEHKGMSYPSVKRDFDGKQADIKKLQQEAAHISGSKHVHLEQISILSNKLNTHSDYKDIDEKCRRKLIQLTTTEMANKDLDHYYEALEKALMKYHSMKMGEINKTIGELWQSTYRGQDIDAIEIRSDPDAASARSFNYRVVMKKGDSELDMRGRCSAGQKVLASLIIRLALAETFCVNCGILALDEPTTNLDHDNIESFAQALTRIIEARRQQTNFQLVVITHDEDFVRMLGRSQFSDRFWRVYKDASHFSKIKAEDIRSLG